MLRLIIAAVAMEVEKEVQYKHVIWHEKTVTYSVVNFSSKCLREYSENREWPKILTLCTWFDTNKWLSFFCIQTAVKKYFQLTFHTRKIFSYEKKILLSLLCCLFPPRAKKNMSPPPSVLKKSLFNLGGGSYNEVPREAFEKNNNKRVFPPSFEGK